MKLEKERLRSILIFRFSETLRMFLELDLRNNEFLEFWDKKLERISEHKGINLKTATIDQVQEFFRDVEKQKSEKLKNKKERKQKGYLRLKKLFPLKTQILNSSYEEWKEFSSKEKVAWKNHKKERGKFNKIESKLKIYENNNKLNSK